MFIVTEHTPGYLADTEPAEFDTYADATAHANQLADELEEQGYTCDRSVASEGNYYAIVCERSDTVAPDLGRFIAVSKELIEVPCPDCNGDGIRSGIGGGYCGTCLATGTIER